MSLLMEDLAALQLDEQIDEVSVNDEYPDALPPAPIPERDYRFKITKWQLDRDKNNNLRLTDGKYPVILVQESEVVEPVEFAGKRGPSYERINTKPFERPKGSGVKASMLGDFTRAFDTTKHWSNIKDGLEILAEEIATNTFCAKAVWEAYDKDYFDAAVAAEGGEGMLTQEQKNAIRKEATIRGMRKFPLLPDGTYASVVEGKSRSKVEARLKFGSFYPSSKTVKL